MGRAIEKRLMREDEIPDFVEAVLATGCNISAVGYESYVICEDNVPKELMAHMSSGLAMIEINFGDRDFLRTKIVTYLRSIGRHVDVEICIGIARSS